MKTTLLTTLLAALAPLAAEATPAGARRIAVLVSLDPAQPNAATVDLFRSVEARLAQSSAWRPVPTGDVKPFLAAPASLQGLGPIAAFKRADFVKALPKGRTKAQAKARRGRMIASVQGMLDTLALDGAVIVDCKPRGMSQVTACGTYYYDRADGRVVAATSKTFRTGIVDATRWAPELVQGLVSGMAAHSTAMEKHRLNRLMSDSEGRSEPREVVLEARVAATGVAGPDRAVKGLPVFGLLAGTAARGYTAGLDLSYGAATATSAGLEAEVREMAAGAWFGVESRALEAMTWDLGFGVSYARVDAVRAASADEPEGRLAVEGVRLRIAPGVLWGLGEGVAVGAAVSYQHLLPLTERASGAYADSRLASSAFGAALRLRASL